MILHRCLPCRLPRQNWLNQSLVFIKAGTPWSWAKLVLDDKGKRRNIKKVITWDAGVRETPHWLFFYVGSFSYTFRAAFVFLSWILYKEFLLHSYFYLGSFSYTSCVGFILCGEFLLHIHAGFIFMWGVSITHPCWLRYTSHPEFTFIWLVCLTHPILALHFWGEFLLHIPRWLRFSFFLFCCCCLFFLGSFANTFCASLLSG